ncbi:restriction endonuclease subunit S [Pseudoalteromonas sp. APC 3356]|uniref:restriction endonuclease subunit S n=1 Tax=unclassified Pseudoalteromonas TaxID=194690 RepID=UPI0002EE5067|nr:MULTISPECIES: restriction endonuclease subunit S [unclassified Pseudoalteromonas]MDN3436031.1 restriction endonuclease subunit S [Pseudoalteromonas sp. APC 3356]
MVWEIVKLGELCRIELGKTPSRSNKNYWDESKVNNNIWLSIADLPLSDKSIMLDSKEYISNAGAELCKIVPKGTLIVSFKLSLGRLAVTGRDLYTNEAIAALYIHDKQKIDQNYLSWYLTFFDWDAAAGSDIKVKGKTLNKAKLKEIEIVVPPILEQKRIVTILDQAFSDIEQARIKTEQNLKNARELFESYLQQVFSQRGEGWRVSKLKEVTSKIGSGATPRGGRAAYKSEGTSLIRSMNVHDRRFKNKDLAFIDDQQADKLSNVVVENNDVLLNITGASVARCCLAPEEYLPARVNQHVSIIRVDRTVISPAFLNFVLTSKYYKDQLLGIGEAGSTRQAITKTQIEEFEVSYPESLEEQQNLLSSLYSLEEKTNDIQRIYIEKLLALDELKKSILQKAFSGELTKEKEGAVA